MTRFLRRLLGVAPIARLMAAAVLILASCSAEPALAAGVGATGLNINATIQGQLTNSNSFSSIKQDLNAIFPLQFTGGTGPGQIDTFWAGSVTVAASSSTTVDLNGSLTDAFGVSVALLHVKYIAIVASTGNANDCQIGPGGSNPFAGPWSGTTPLTSVSPGEMASWSKGQGSATGWAVVASTGDIIKVANSGSGTSVTCTLYIAGTST